VPRRNKVKRWKVIIPTALIVAAFAITIAIGVMAMGAKLVALAIAIVVGICWVVFLIVSKFNELLKIDRESLKFWDLRFAIVLKIAQSLAFIAAGAWALFGAYSVYKREAERSATYGCSATTTLRVDPIPGGDGQKSLYLVTVDTLLRNDTDRVVPITEYKLDFYVGKTLAGTNQSFVVTKPTTKLSHPTIDWKQFDRYIYIRRDYKTLIGQIPDNKEPKKDSEPIANSNESGIRLKTFAFFRLPAGQSSTFENQFVISASENDWIATDSVLIHGEGTEYHPGEIIPETRVENIAVALRRGSEIAPKSSPTGSNPAPR
jgi:hypothetical protein